MTLTIVVRISFHSYSFKILFNYIYTIIYLGDEEPGLKSLNIVCGILEVIVQKGAEQLYDNYLQSILPKHEMDVTESMLQSSIQVKLNFHFIS